MLSLLASKHFPQSCSSVGSCVRARQQYMQMLFKVDQLPVAVPIQQHYCLSSFFVVLFIFINIFQFSPAVAQLLTVFCGDPLKPMKYFQKFICISALHCFVLQFY